MQYSLDVIQKILLKIFPDIELANVGLTGYVQVNCPFHDDKKASAGVKPEDGFFHCFTCGTSYSFNQLVKLKFGNSINIEYLADQDKELQDYINNELKESYSNGANFEELKQWSISPEIIQQLQIASYNVSLEQNQFKPQLTIPVIVNNLLYGFKYYKSNNDPKSWSTKGLKSGLIIPFDAWVNNPKPTLICEGEKDMLVARSFGFNAITITGGSQALPKNWIGYFKNREIWIAYDKDEAGQIGSNKLATLFFENQITKIKILTKFHQTLQDKGDITDWFNNPNLQVQDKSLYFLELISQEKYFSKEDIQKYKKKVYQPIHLSQVSNPLYYNKKVQSLIQVKTEDVRKKSIPKSVSIRFPSAEESTASKIIEVEVNKNNMDLIIYFLNTTIQTGKRFKEEFMEKVYYQYKLNEDPNEYLLPKATWFENKKHHVSVFISEVSPYVESDKDLDSNQDELASYMTYSFDRLAISQIYTIRYKPYSHEVTGRYNTVLLVEEFESAANSVESFVISDQTKRLLSVFQPRQESINDKLKRLYSSIRNKYVKHLDFHLWFAYELTFHSVLKFKIRNGLHRGTIYTNVIGDTRSGKSSLAKLNMDLYNQGKFVNAKLSTITSLTGGVSQTKDGPVVLAGILPRNNKSLIILEEIHGMGNAYFKQITDVKSSEMVNLGRVAGELKLQCSIRLIEISNPISDNRDTKTISDFSNGVQLIKNLIYSPEDIARNDIYITSKKADQYTSPFSSNHVLEQLSIDISEQAYQERIKWIWSRKSDQIIFEDETYLWTKAMVLNEKYDCESLTLLGPEAYLKLARLSIALAGILCSTYNETFEKILVRNEHVDVITNWIDKLYSSDIMSIDKYVLEEKSYYQCNDNDVVNLSRIYSEYPDAITHLANTQDTTKDLLILHSGKKFNEINPLFADLQRNKFLKPTGTSKIIPSVKFRQAYKKISKIDLVTNNINEGGLPW